ncbi:putative xylose isomerase [Helianthus annuus]|nr:putative xylose isomerase [Helianthus annuus]
MGRCREITYVVDLFIAHVAGMDTLAHGLHNATRLTEDGYSHLSMFCHDNHHHHHRQ